MNSFKCMRVVEGVRWTDRGEVRERGELLSIRVGSELNSEDLWEMTGTVVTRGVELIFPVLFLLDN